MNERKIGIETEKHFLKNTRYIFFFQELEMKRDKERKFLIFNFKN